MTAHSELDEDISLSGRLRRLLDKSEIAELGQAYAHYVDRGMYEKWVALFTLDGFLDEREFGTGLHEGHDGIRTYSGALESKLLHMVHHVTNHVIELHSDDTASGTVYAMIDSETRTGDRRRYETLYEDTYVKVDGAWRIQGRRLRKTFEPEYLSDPT